MSKPPIEVPQGAIRFNTDSQKMEFFAQDQWWRMATDFPTLDGGARAVYCNGSTPTILNTSRYFTIATQGDSVDFGTLTRTVFNTPASFSDRTRGVIMGGNTGPSTITSTSDTITIASTGSAVAGFVTLQGNLKEHGGLSNATRGIRFGGGNTAIDYSTIASGGTQQDFGTFRGGEQGMGAASPTRGLLTRGNDGGLQAGVDLITIASTGNAQVYGDLTVGRYGGASSSSTTRAVFGGGWAPSVSNIIDYFEIASTGNAADFGDLTVARYGMSNCGASDNIRGMFMGGHRNPNPQTDTVDYITFATQGNAVDFGNLDVAKSGGAAVSNGHGGL